MASLSNNGKLEFHFSDFLLKFAYVVILFTLLQSQSVECATTLPPTTIALRTKAVNKIKTYATSFLTDQQLADVMDTLSLDFYQAKDATTIQNDIMNVVVGSLTGTQLMTGLTVYNSLTKDLGGSEATTAIIGKLTTVLMNNLSPFMQQVQKKIADMKKKSKGQNACFNQQYRMTLQFFTFNRMKTIITRVKNNLDANTYAIAKKDIGSLINWSLYGL